MSKLKGVICNLAKKIIVWKLFMKLCWNWYGYLCLTWHLVYIKVILVCFTVKVFQSQGFEVRGYYLSLSLTMSTSFPWKLVWRSKIPPRVAFFSWTVALGKILTFDNLRKRCIIIVDWCYMCRRSGESGDHLLLHYPIAYEQQTMV